MPYSNPTIRINKDMKYKYQYKIDVGKLSNPIAPSSGVSCGEPYHVTVLGIHLASWYIGLVLFELLENTCRVDFGHQIWLVEIAYD